MHPFDGGLNGDPIGSHSDEWEFNGPDYYGNQKFTADPLYYFSRLYEVQVEYETDKAYLMLDTKGKWWVPKQLLKIDDDKAYLFNKFKIKYLEE